MLPQPDTRFAAFYGPALAQMPKTRTACRRRLFNLEQSVEM
jgi:hypothetical protein